MVWGETFSMANLTNREREIVDLLAQGKRLTEIAAMLQMSYSTVTWHAQNIRAKTDTLSTFELAVKAARTPR
jgi:DNA-binding CsgD family transcriptional regulator